MFEQIANRRRRSGRKASAAVAASVVAHVGIGMAMLIATFWQVDKLAPDKSRTLQTAAASMPSPNLGGAPPPPPMGGPKKTTVKSTKRRTRALRQPDVDVEVAPTTDVSGDGSGRDGGEPGGQPGGIPGGTGNDPYGLGVGIGDGDGLGTGDLEIQKPPAPPPVTIVPPNIMAGRRIAGDPLIAPPDEVRLQLLRAGSRQLVATVKMCLSTTGVVNSLTVLSSSGHASYDAKLRREMRTWRYKPYRARGVAVPVCTAVTFVYRMK